MCPSDDCSPPGHGCVEGSIAGFAVAATGTAAVTGSPALALAISISLALALPFSTSIADAVIRAIVPAFLEFLLFGGTLRFGLLMSGMPATPVARASLRKGGSGGENGDEYDGAYFFGFHDLVWLCGSICPLMGIFEEMRSRIRERNRRTRMTDLLYFLFVVAVCWVEQHPSRSVPTT
jgi:hypothetical protein